MGLDRPSNAVGSCWRGCVALVSSALLILPLSAPARSQDLPLVRVGFVLDGPSERNDLFRSGVEREIRTLLEGEFEVLFPNESLHVGDWTLDGLRQAIEAALAEPDVDVVIALGLGASSAIAQWGPLPRPVVAPLLVDAGRFGILTEDQRSSVENLSFVAVPSRGAEVVHAFVDLAGVRNVAVVMHELYRDMLSHIPIYVGRVAETIGVKTTFIWVSGGPSEIVAALPDGIDGIVLAPTYHLSRSESTELANAFIERGLPSFSLFGRSDVELGHLATLSPGANAQRLARRTALNVQRIILGEPASDIPVHFETARRLAINIATARAIRVWPRFDLLVDAELINPDPEPLGSELTIVDAVREALAMNLDLTAVEHFVAAGIGDVKEARSELYPQIDALLGATVIDKDRARGSGGTTARRTWEAAVRLEQLIWSEPVWAGIDISELTYQAREWLRRELILDVTQATAVSYLDVLRTKTLERIRRDDVALTRSNLELAETRRRVGIADRSEVFRWESQLATSKRNLVVTTSQMRVAQLLLKRLLHRSLGEHLELAETGLDDPTLFPHGRRLEGVIDNPWSLAVFEDHLVQRGLQNSPELQQIAREIGVGRRLVESRSAAFWSPTVGLFAEGSRAFHKSGTFAPAAGVVLPDRNDWTLGLSVNYPIYTGGARHARLFQAREEHAQLLVERAAAAERVEQSVRSSVQFTFASHTSIRLSQQAAEAASDNLELVLDSYGQGIVSILDLLDAQSAALTAELEAASAIYDFLIDLMDVQRAAGEFHVFLNEEDMTRWEEGVFDALRAAGLAVDRP
jgi:outer membrane protein TolC